MSSRTFLIISVFFFAAEIVISSCFRNIALRLILESFEENVTLVLGVELNV